VQVLNSDVKNNDISGIKGSGNVKNQKLSEEELHQIKDQFKLNIQNQIEPR
jgi:hypothetical protein